MSALPTERTAETLDAAPFPPDFLLGVATAAYQIEGAATEDGRGRSIWDTFSHTPGRIAGGHTGDVACDHYHRLDGDLDQLAWLGVGAYRFSLSWPRWQPTGSGPVEPRGAAFYDRMVDGLLERGIAPWPTLYHWDLPQALEDRGGWRSRDTAYRFADYAAAVHRTIGDRVQSLTTLNEPWCSAFLGYAAGVHAPGVQDPAGAVCAVHHLLLGHGLAVSAIRAQDPSTRLGISLNCYPIEPATPAQADVEAARRIDGVCNRIFLDPLLRGRYPEDVVADLAHVTGVEHVHDGDLELISSPLDFLGENYYSPHVVSAAPDSTGAAAGRRGARLGAREVEAENSPWVGSEHVQFVHAGRPRTQMEWEVEAPGLRRVLNRLADDYDCPPLYVTENGAAYPDELVAGAVHDPQRTDYLAGHLRALLDAVDDGVDVRGYFLWSAWDNFEWAWGFTRRFGLVHVDFETLERTPKDSAHWYREVTRTRRLVPPVLPG